MFGEKVSEQASVQQKIGESFEELRTADLIIDSLSDFLHQEGQAGRSIIGVDRLKIRRESAMAAQLCLKSGTRLSGMMGVRSQSRRKPDQRHFIDVRTMSMHGGMNWENATTPTGRYLLGIETGDSLIDENNLFID